jgi:uncharacterized protein YbjT (DUF2867 family)
MKIAITGPTGHIGRRLVQELLKKGGSELVLLARDPNKLKAEQARGAKVIQGDLAEPGFLKRATVGCNALFFMIPPDTQQPDVRGFQKQMAKLAAEAIKANKIERTVFLSSMGAHLGQGVGPVNGLHDAEEELRAVAKNLTILRPTFFMENFMMSIPTIKQAQTIYMPITGSTKIPMIATQDIAQRAADELLNDKAHGVRVLSLHGPKEYAFEEVAQTIGQAWGKEVKYVKVTPEQTREAMRGMGVGQNFTDLILEMYGALENGHMHDERPRSKETTTPTTWEIFAKQSVLPALKG